MKILRLRDGYIFLVSILVIGAVASATAISLLLLGWASEQNGYLVTQSSQAYEYAHTCAERALRSLRADLGYAGSGRVLFSNGSCFVEPTAGTGNEDRAICVEAISGNSTHRMEIGIARVFPSVQIRRWEEVNSFTACP